MVNLSWELGTLNFKIVAVGDTSSLMGDVQLGHLPTPNRAIEVLVEWGSLYSDKPKCFGS